MNEKNDLRARVHSFEGLNARIILENDQTFLWPIKHLPEGAQVGDIIRVVLSTEESEAIERTKIAKALLNEILNS